MASAALPPSATAKQNVAKEGLVTLKAILAAEHTVNWGKELGEKAHPLDLEINVVGSSGSHVHIGMNCV